MARTFIPDWTRWQVDPCPAAQLVSERFGGVWLKATGSAAVAGRLNVPAKPADPFHIDPLFFISAANVLAQPQLVPGAFHYLVPGFAGAQAAFLWDVLSKANHGQGPKGWLVKLDVEELGVTTEDVRRFIQVWAMLGGWPLWVYTSKESWVNKLKIGMPSAYANAPYLEQAHWVDPALRLDPTTPYASHHARGIDPSWWNAGYGGWPVAKALQFTDYARIANRRTSCSLFMGTPAELRTYTHR